jgi:hypothetical protein
MALGIIGVKALSSAFAGKQGAKPMTHSTRLSLLKTVKDIDQAVQRYRASDLRGEELYQQWLDIRDASLQQGSPESEYDHILGEDSY